MCSIVPSLHSGYLIDQNAAKVVVLISVLSYLHVSSAKYFIPTIQQDHIRLIKFYDIR